MTATIREYEVVEQGPCHRASNGLKYTLFTLRHADTGWVHEGKRYELAALKDTDRATFHAQVTRHAAVAMDIAREKQKHIQRVFQTFEEEQCRWVVQEKLTATRLSKHLQKGPYAGNIYELMGGVLKALRHLHGRGYVRRELAPDSILVEEDTGNAILTDFELVKHRGGSRRGGLSSQEYIVYSSSWISIRGY